MKTTPILFSAAMIQALLAGRKSQTRRIVKPQPAHSCRYTMNGNGTAALHHVEKTDSGYFVPVPVKPTSGDHRLPCKYGHQGDLLWVRETWSSPESNIKRPGRVAYDADGRCGMVTDEREFWPHGRILQASGYEKCFPKTGSQTYGLILYGKKWRPSIHMPRWASRITLELTGVRVERLQDISKEDAAAEGFERTPNVPIDPRDWYRNLWESINGAGSWDENPWVWVLDFPDNVHQMNIDQFLKQKAA